MSAFTLPCSLPQLRWWIGVQAAGLRFGTFPIPGNDTRFFFAPDTDHPSAAPTPRDNAPRFPTGGA